MNYIEEQLQKKTENFIEGAKYYKHWILAKEYLPEILQTISHYFPHYSRHDKTHSETILNNIIKIVGKDAIAKMSVVDLWLLLTSAYYHDFGMTVSAEDKLLFLEEGSDFVNYIKNIKEDKASSMSTYAEFLEVTDGKIYYKRTQLSSENIDSQRFLIADFIRRKHAQRSQNKINTSNSLHLPGNPIPERIIRILGRICLAHTQSHETLMLIPQIESSGCGTENCHPLYIACLLRLGDLLDIDTNRVSDVLLGTLTSIPIDSLAYNQTNRDITHIRIDRSVVEITAECETYEVAELVNNWFQMIDDEFTFQTKNWYLIVPDIEYGSLPSTGELIVKLNGYDNFNGKERPHFKVDGSKAIEMFQGAGLYNDPSQCIRELLQNSIDAIYLRIFKENPKLKSIEDFRGLCKGKYPIEISLTKDKIENGYSYWTFILTDEGLGMTKEDLKFLACTGSSSQNNEKQKIIEAMPIWMRPSGTFGIGFQSVFLITDKVFMRTRRYGREETLSLELYNPAGKEKGNILLATNKDEDIPFGTRIEYSIKMPINSGWKVNFDDFTSINVINTFDFARDNSFDIKAARIIDEIYKFSYYSMIDINLTFNNEPIEVKSNFENNFDFYDEETGLQIKLGGRLGLYFRNQEVSKFSLNLPLLTFSINIIHGNAKDILTLNRNDIKSEYKSKLRNDIHLATFRYILNKFDELDDLYVQKNEEVNSIRQYAAAYLQLNKKSNINNNSQICNDLPEDWKNLKIKGCNNDSYSIKTLLDAEYIVEISNERKSLYFYKAGESEPFFILTNDNHNVDSDMYNFLCYILHEEFPGICYQEGGIKLSKNQNGEYISIDDKARKKWLQFYKQRANGMRSYMPCNDKYKALEVKDHMFELTFSSFGHDYPIMVCPYICKSINSKKLWSKQEIEYLVDDKVIDFVYQHRKEESVTKEQLIKNYEIFKQDYSAAFNELSSDDCDLKGS